MLRQLAEALLRLQKVPRSLAPSFGNLIRRARRGDALRRLTMWNGVSTQWEAKNPRTTWQSPLGRRGSTWRLRCTEPLWWSWWWRHARKPWGTAARRKKGSVAKPSLCILTQLPQQKDTQRGCCQARLRKGCGGLTQTQQVQQPATVALGSGWRRHRQPATSQREDVDVQCCGSEASWFDIPLAFFILRCTCLFYMIVHHANTLHATLYMSSLHDRTSR